MSEGINDKNLKIKVFLIIYTYGHVYNNRTILFQQRKVCKVSVWKERYLTNLQSVLKKKFHKSTDYAIMWECALEDIYTFMYQ